MKLAILQAHQLGARPNNASTIGGLLDIEP